MLSGLKEKYFCCVDYCVVIDVAEQLLPGSAQTLRQIGVAGSAAGT